MYTPDNFKYTGRLKKKGHSKDICVRYIIKLFFGQLKFTIYNAPLLLISMHYKLAYERGYNKKKILINVILIYYIAYYITHTIQDLTSLYNG